MKSWIFSIHLNIISSKQYKFHFMLRLRAHSTEDYAVVLDYLQFDNDMAFNFLISQADIHTTLVLTDEQAEHLVWSGIFDIIPLALCTHTYWYM